MTEECRFQCMKCKLNWAQSLSDYAVDKKPCPRCGSIYYTWLNYETVGESK